jgi:hypothetical protein
VIVGPEDIGRTAFHGTAKCTRLTAAAHVNFITHETFAKDIFRLAHENPGNVLSIRALEVLAAGTAACVLII